MSNQPGSTVGASINRDTVNFGAGARRRNL